MNAASPPSHSGVTAVLRKAAVLLLVLLVGVGGFGADAQPQAETREEIKLEIARLDRAIAADASNAELHVRRGGIWFRAGDNGRALRDFDRAVALDRRLLPYLWQRGISLYYAGRFTDCVDQFESHRQVNPNDVENAAWHLLCLARIVGLDTAREGMLPVGPDTRRPMAEIDAFYRGGGSEASVLEAAGDSPSGRFYAYLYLGLLADLEERSAAARRHLAEADGIGFPHYMGDVARLHWTHSRSTR